MLKYNLKQFGKTSLALVLLGNLAWIPTANAETDEFNGPTPEQVAVNEVKNERVLLQRVDQRTLMTNLGKVVVPPMVTLTDTRDPEDWYKPTNAKAEFYFTKDLELVRVVISE